MGRRASGDACYRVAGHGVGLTGPGPKPGEDKGSPGPGGSSGSDDSSGRRSESMNGTKSNRQGIW
jgi:hypothetical protein